MTTYVWWHDDVFGSHQDGEQVTDVIELGQKTINWLNLQNNFPQTFWSGLSWQMACLSSRTGRRLS